MTFNFPIPTFSLSFLYPLISLHVSQENSSQVSRFEMKELELIIKKETGKISYNVLSIRIGVIFEFFSNRLVWIFDSLRFLCETKNSNLQQDSCVRIWFFLFRTENQGSQNSNEPTRKKLKNQSNPNREYIHILLIQELEAENSKRKEKCSLYTSP